MAQNLSNLVNNLPTELLKDRETFNNIINKDILNKIPQNKLNSILNKYLPSTLSDQDKLNTINDLFDNKLNFLNINQMDTFYKQAKIHKFEPDLVKTLNEVKLLKKKAYRLEEKKFQLNLLNEVLDRKKLLMEKALNSPPNIFINCNKMIVNDNDDFNRKVDERYHKELEKIDLEDSNLNDDKIDKNQNSDDEEELCNINKINYSVNKQEYLMMLKNHRRKKIRNQIDENNLEELSIKKVLDRILENPSKSFKLEIEQKIQSKNSTLKRNKKPVVKKSSSIELKSSLKINQLDKQKSNESIVITKPQIKSFDNNLKVLINKEPLSSNNNLENNENKINNYEKEPSSFFSLIRDIFYNNSISELKLTLHKLEEFVKEKLKLYDPKLSSSGWQVDLVQSAMNYLSSALVDYKEKNIPLVDYKEKNQQWQWIGNDGNDSDDILIKLNNDWIKELNKYSLLDSNRSVPPAIYQTTWTVKESTKEEKEEYRKQELLRYKNPNKSFTFSLHNYKSIVGPVKGSSSNYSLAKQKDKPETSLLKERPPFVTLLSLVKDSAARLPNGQGTRTDIATLLKDSQYLRDDLQDEQISAIVSGALDRLHYEKDCSVRYDEKRKIWIYLHRFRSEEDFNRLHQMQIDANLAKKSIQQKVTKKSSNSNKLNNNNTSKIPNITTSIDNVINSITTTSSTINNNSQVTIISKTIDDNKIDDQNKIKLNQESIKSDVNIIDCTLLKQIPYQSRNDEIIINNKRELNGKKKLNNNNTTISSSKKLPSSTKQVIIKSINTSELVNKSIKQKYQKQTTSNKKLKTENSEFEIKSVINNRTISADQLIKQNKQLNHTNSTLPVPINNNNQKTSITKDDVNKIIIQQNNTNRINLSNGSLILSPSNNTINGFTSFTMSKNSINQILIHPQNGTIANCLTLKGKLITNQSNSPLSLRTIQGTVQGMRIVPCNISQNTNLSQQQLIQQQITSNNITSNNLTKPQIILPKCTDNLPTQINISTSSSNHPKSIIMSCPSLTLSTKTTS